MTRVLVLAYYFPPIGGAGAQRPAKLVRYLPEHGFESVVVTAPGAAGGQWTPRDDELLRDVPAGTEVLRVPGPEPLEPGRWRSRAERWGRVRPRWADWWVDGTVAAGRRAEDVDLIYAWMSPFESAEAASRLSRELGRPWVADLGDPWALDEMIVYPSRVHRRLERARMGKLLATASAVVMSTPEAVARVRAQLPELDDVPVLAIPNGYDAADFAAPAPEQRDGPLRIVHTGYLHTELGRRTRRSLARRALGGAVRGVDILTRSHVYLLEAIEAVIADDPTAEIELHLAGVTSEADREVAGGRRVVRMHGYLPHGETVALMRGADLLFLPMHSLPPGSRAGIVPGKTYEYLAAGPPILGAVPDGDARDILLEAGHSAVCRPDDVGGLKDAITAALARKRAGEPAPQARATVVERFEYRRLAGELAAVFGGVAGERPLVPSP